MLNPRHLFFLACLLWHAYASAFDPYFPDSLTVKNAHLPDEIQLTQSIEGYDMNLGIRVSSVPDVKGNMILIQPKNHIIENDRLFNYLKLYLTYKGWNTLSISLPRPPSPDTLIIPKGDERKAGKENHILDANAAKAKYPSAQINEVNLQIEKIIVASIKLALEKTPHRPNTFVYIAAQQHAGTLLKLFSEEKIPKPILIVMIDPYLRGESTQHKLYRLQLEAITPIMEIAHLNISDHAKNQRQNRVEKIILSRRRYRFYENYLDQAQEDTIKKILNDIHGMSYTILHDKSLKNPGHTPLKTQSKKNKGNQRPPNKYFLKNEKVDEETKE
tara:strand:+ start:2845 stop:3834 length:990 start_codon:yes stop_codon:yes gene_type:complete